MRKKLTLKQKRFVDEYLLDLNATQAAVRAGYSAKNADKIGPRLVGRSRVAEAIAKAMQARSERIELDQDWVIEQLRKNVERAMQVIEVLDSNGNATGVFQYQGSVANRALELIGKHLGMFRDKPEERPRDYVPLEERILQYAREGEEQRAIDEAANVSRLDPPASNR